jgi:von Willebrand factor type A domain
MDLRPPASTSNEEIYQLLGQESAPATISAHSTPANQEHFPSDLEPKPNPHGAPGKTVISDPVVVCLTGSGPPPADSPESPDSPGTVQSPPAIPAHVERPEAVSARTSPPKLAKSEEAASRLSPTHRVSRLRPKRRRHVRLRYLMQAWGVSLVVHVAILSALAAATFTPDVVTKIINFDSALAGFRNGEPEILPIYADPDNIARDKAIGDENASTAGEPVQVLSGDGGDDGGGAIVAGGVGTGRPSNTPRVRGVGKGRINEGSSLPGVKIDGLGASPLSLLPVAPAADLGGGGKIAGDPIFDVKEIGVALDQLAREILRHLKDHKLTVVWLFDESASMQDDQKTILQKFDRVSSELKLNTDPKKKNASALNHAIVGFGQGMDYVLGKPQEDIDQIGRAIKQLKIDSTGTENTMHAVREIVERYASLVKKDRRLLIVLVTDESGDDGADVEEARQALKKYHVPLYVIGRQSLFGYPYAHHRYVDPVTKDVYHPLIRRGPETADVEVYQWDGLYERWDEQPSGFAPYELARLTRDSGGIYFVLPSEEFMRIRQREQAYSITQLKEYLPEYDHRLNYVEKRNSSPLRRLLYAIVLEGKNLLYRRDFPIEPEELIKAALEEGQKATVKLNVLLDIQKRLEDLAKIREREPEKRWQAHYDLMLAQTVAFQVKAYEYRALMASIVKATPVPKRPAGPDLVITWVVNHSKAPLAPKNETVKKYAEAERLLKEVILRHPKTPWADLAQDTLNRGFSVQFDEWHHNAKYYERSQFVPKY